MEKKKRLLVIGGGTFIDYILRYGDRRDLELVTTGNTKTSPLKRAIAESYMTNTVDRGGMIKLIREKKIDGVFLGGNEDNISAAFSYLEPLGLPSYVTRRTWEITSNKELFKRACAEEGIPTPERIAFERIDERTAFPIVIKPADSCGSNGVYLCGDYEDFKRKAELSRKFSRSGAMIAEEYLTGCEISVHYTVKDGKAKLSSMSDKYESTHCGEFNPIPDCYCYPSVFLSEYMEKYDERMKDLFKKLGVDRGIVFVQGFYTGGDFKFFEMGYRIPGTYTFKYSDALNGICALDLVLDYSAGIDPVDFDLEKENAYFNKYCCTMTMLSKGGTIAAVRGLDAVKKNKNVISVEERYDIGDTVKVTNSLGQAHIWVYIAADTVGELKKTIRFVNDTVRVSDAEGNDILYHDFDADRLLFQERL